MPVIVANLEPEVLSKIMRLVESGLFASPEQFLQVAVRNQLVYEHGASRPDENPARDRQSARYREPGQRNGTSQETVEKLRVSVAGWQIDDEHVEMIPDEKLSGGKWGEWISPLRIGDPEKSHPEPRTAVPARDNERISGLVNRILPLKLPLRFLLNAASGRPDWPMVGNISKALNAVASELGFWLHRCDTLAKRRRDELLATGLPRLGNPASCDRFFTQFVARTTRDGNVFPGAIFQYGLAVNDSGRVALTPLGIEFSAIRNPILDDDPDSTLTNDERTFFITNVVPRVPAELRDFNVVITAVRSGTTSPEALTWTLADALRAEEPVRKWTDVMMRSHMSGVVSRMVELHLLRRTWEGRRVTYEIGELAGAVFENVRNVGERQTNA